MDVHCIPPKMDSTHHIMLNAHDPDEKKNFTLLQKTLLYYRKLNFTIENFTT